MNVRMMRNEWHLSIDKIEFEIGILASSLETTSRAEMKHNNNIEMKLEKAIWQRSSDGPGSREIVFNEVRRLP